MTKCERLGESQKKKSKMLEARNEKKKKKHLYLRLQKRILRGDKIKLSSYTKLLKKQGNKLFVDRRSGLIIGLDSSKQRLDYTQEKLRLSEKNQQKPGCGYPGRLRTLLCWMEYARKHFTGVM